MQQLKQKFKVRQAYIDHLTLVKASDVIGQRCFDLGYIPFSSKTATDNSSILTKMWGTPFLMKKDGAHEVRPKLMEINM